MRACRGARSGVARRWPSIRTTACSRSTTTAIAPSSAGLAALEPGFSLVTVWYGDGADLAEAEGLTRLVHEAWPAVEEVEVRHGGQPHYRYLISVE